MKRLVLVCIIVLAYYLTPPLFGGTSPHYHDGRFWDEEPTPTLVEGHSMLGELWKYIVDEYPRRAPVSALPAVKASLKDANMIVWFGHSSSFINEQGLSILLDPVLGDLATLSAYKGMHIYTAADLPRIDYILISHDHYDHMDYETLMALKNKTGKIVCGLGVGKYLRDWGFPETQIHEMDWGDTLQAGNGVNIYALPSRHQSGRGIQKDGTLWASYLVAAPQRKIYYSGDGGYDQRFKAIRKTFGDIDIAILENGQYDSAWGLVHMLPEQSIQAARDLGAKRLIPVHNSKFTLARHPWDEPLRRLSALNEGSVIQLLTPRPGQPVWLNDSTQHFDKWWEGLE